MNCGMFAKAFGLLALCLAQFFRDQSQRLLMHGFCRRII